jgi:dTDP-4-dehydrorhamnose 3,5-epimerase
MLPGLKVQDLKKNVDERGFFAEIMREDWKELLGEDRIVQSNLSFSYPGMIRAWHRHSRGQVDHFLVLKGSLARSVQFSPSVLLARAMELSVR